jgi:hypothetical protein
MHRTVAGPVVGLLAAAAISGGCATASFESGEGFKLVRSKHFNVYTTPGTRPEAVMNSLEFGYATLASSFFRSVETGPIDTLLLDDAEFKGVMGYERSGAALSSVPGGGKIGAGGLIVIQNDPGSDAHNEMLAHVFLHKYIPNAPLWFHEGFAAYVRTVEYKEGGGERMACFGKPGGEPKTYVPLKELVTISWDKYSAETKDWFKHTARSLIDYVRHGEQEKNAPQLGALVDGIKNGRDGAELLGGLLEGLNLEQLSTKVVEHGNSVAHLSKSGSQARGLCPWPFPVLPDKAPDVADERASEPAPAGDVKAMLDGLRKLPGRENGYAPWYPADVVAKAGG